MRLLQKIVENRELARYRHNATLMKFKNISIRGRVAYGICCLENALEHYNLSGAGWNILLRILWWYTELSTEQEPIFGLYYLDRWARLLRFDPFWSYYRNRTYEEYKSEIFPWLPVKEDMLTKDEYELLIKDYENMNDVICELLEQIYHIGSSNLDCGIHHYSPETLEPLGKLLKIMKKNNLPLPSIEPFRQYLFESPDFDEDTDGYGIMFDGTQYSKFVDTYGPSKK